MKRIIIIVLSLSIILGFIFWRFGPNISLFKKEDPGPVTLTYWGLWEEDSLIRPIIEEYQTLNPNVKINYERKSSLNKKEDPGPVTLTYWGLWEEDSLIRPIIEEYQTLNPNVKINYERKSSLNYRTRVQAQIQEGVGPDVFRIHNSWLPMFINNNFLAPSPATIFTISEYKTLFYPVALEAFTQGGSIYASPLEVDGLALFYNEELLNNVGGKVPKNWQEFIDTANKMTVKDADGIKTAGAAVGTASN